MGGVEAMTKLRIKTAIANILGRWYRNLMTEDGINLDITPLVKQTAGRMVHTKLDQR
jgi:hypothetical protein